MEKKQTGFGDLGHYDWEKEKTIATFICSRCRKDFQEEEMIETEEGFTLCNSCDCIRNSCINEPTEERTLKDFLKECRK